MSIKLCRKNYEGVTGIYSIRNKINNKIYIGSAVNLYKRLSLHYYELKKYTHCNRHLQRAWNKYGEENFECIILEYCDRKDKLLREQYWIDTSNCLSPVGYNILSKALDFSGFKHSEKSKKLISLKRMGKKHSEETLSKMRIGRTGKATKRVINIETGEIFNSIREAANSLCMKFSTLSVMLKGQNPNKTKIRYYEI